jgi:hypothetical protein
VEIDMSIHAFNPRGTSGAGKTTVARHFLHESGAQPIIRVGNKNRIYKGTLYGVPFYFLGDYTVVCGGCDTIESVHLAADLINQVMNFGGGGILIYEGLMISHMIGTVGAAVKGYGKRHTMAFLDTPLDTCLARVEERRSHKNNPKPFNPANTIKDWRAVDRCKHNAIQQGFQVITLDHKRAIPQAEEYIHGLCELSRAGEVDPGARKGEGGLGNQSS